MRDERGQASAFLVGILLLGLLAAGLAIDGARLFTVRRDLQNVADSAALAGASAIDEGTYRSSAGRTVVLDPVAARQAVDEVLRASALPPIVRVDVRVEPERVVVKVDRPVAPLFLGLAGLGPERIGAHASASPRTG